MTIITACSADYKTTKRCPVINASSDRADTRLLPMPSNDETGYLPAAVPMDRCPGYWLPPPETDDTIRSISACVSAISGTISGVIASHPGSIRISRDLDRSPALLTATAKAATVGVVNSLCTLECIPSWRIRSNNRIASSECPPVRRNCRSPRHDPASVPRPRCQPAPARSGSRRHILAADDRVLFRCRQRTAIDLPARRKRQCLQHHIRRRNHVLGEAPLQMNA